MKISAIIIDDEKNNRENLKLLLSQHCPEVNIIGTAENAKEGIQQIRNCLPQLIFLDIQMPGGDGFTVLKEVKELHFEVIFVTAFNQYAIQAIKFSALDYLLKPIHSHELVSAVEKAKNKIMSKMENLQLKQFITNTALPQNEKKIALPTHERIEFVKTSDILYCKGENNYTTFFLKSGKQLLISKTLKEYERILSVDYKFFRIHRSYLVNLNEIKTFIKRDSGSVVLNDGTTLLVSKNNKEELLKRLK